MKVVIHFSITDGVIAYCNFVDLHHEIMGHLILRRSELAGDTDHRVSFKYLSQLECVSHVLGGRCNDSETDPSKKLDDSLALEFNESFANWGP